MPVEMLRIWPLINICTLGCFMNEKQSSWRDLHTGWFDPYPMVYVLPCICAYVDYVDYVD